MTGTATTPSVCFVVPGHPRPQGSKTYLGRGRMVESSRHLPAWRTTIAMHTRQAVTTPIPGPVAIRLDFAMPRTKAMRDRPAPPMIQQPDADKLARAALDALVAGGALIDDAHVTHLTSTKRRANPDEAPGVTITIGPAKPNPGP